MRNNKAFTLIEILIVVIIVGILAGIAVMRAGNTKDLGVINTAAGNVKTLSNLRNSLLGLDKDRALADGSTTPPSGERYIRPNSSFTLHLSGGGDQSSTVVFSYTAPANLVGNNATNLAISAQFNNSLVLPYEIFESLKNVKKNNVLQTNVIGGSYGLMTWEGKLMHTYVRFDPGFVATSPVVIEYLGVASGGTPAGTWIVRN